MQVTTVEVISCISVEDQALIDSVSSAATSSSSAGMNELQTGDKVWRGIRLRVHSFHAAKLVPTYANEDRGIRLVFPT
jgi:hypothetical protein